jgi:Asp-tRNA(Asn)/Glu-tRNA(Gln) amidotransferase A subunit family amidase
VPEPLEQLARALGVSLPAEDLEPLAESLAQHCEFVAPMLESGGPAAAEAARTGGPSAVELVEKALARLAETEPLVHAYVFVDEDGAREAARAADATAPRGPLHGLPFAVKDVFSVEGMPAECGSRAMEGHVPVQDAAAVRRLRDAGAVLVGKQATHEFTCGLDEPPTRNPWDLSHYPGGSSAGGGVSVAVGSCAFALGTDAAGSVRIPAAVTAVVGLKPTHGAVSSEGILREATAPSLDHVGILAPGVDEAARVLGALAPVSPSPPTAGLSGLRVAVLDATAHELAGLQPEVAKLFDTACAQLERLGARLVEIEVPSLELARQAVFTLFPAELAAGHRRLLGQRPQAYHPDVRRLVELGLLLPALHLQAAEGVRARMRAELEERFAELGLDALVTPTMPRTSMPLSEMDPGTDLATLVPYTCPFNLTGQPALSVPCGFTAAGLPAGLQVIGRRHDEQTVLRIGRAYEASTDWRLRRPPLL